MGKMTGEGDGCAAFGSLLRNLFVAFLGRRRWGNVAGRFVGLRISAVELVGDEVFQAQDDGHEQNEQRIQFVPGAAEIDVPLDFLLAAREAKAIFAQERGEILGRESRQIGVGGGDIDAESAAHAGFGAAGSSK